MKFLNRINLKINEYFYDRIKVKQNDTARYLLFNLLDDGVPFSLENKTVRVYGLKPDGTKVFNNLTIINAARGLVELQLTTQMLVKPGCLKLELVIYEATDILSTTKFDIDIISCIRDDSAIESTNEFSALTLGLSKLDEWDKYFKETSGAIEEKYTERLNEIDSSLEEIENIEHIPYKLDRKTTYLNRFGWNCINLVGDSILHGANAPDIYKQSWGELIKKSLQEKYNSNNQGFEKGFCYMKNTVAEMKGFHEITLNEDDSWQKVNNNTSICLSYYYTMSRSKKLSFKPKKSSKFRIIFEGLTNGGTFKYYTKSGKWGVKTQSTNQSADSSGLPFYSEEMRCDLGDEIIIESDASGTEVRILGIQYYENEKDIMINNYGRSGATLSNVPDKTLELWADCQILFFSMGHNDSFYPDDFGKFTDRINKLIEYIKKYNPFVIVNDFVWAKEPSFHIRSELKRLADETGGIYIPYTEILPYGTNVQNWINGGFLSDGSHPTPNGMRIIHNVNCKTLNLPVSTNRDNRQDIVGVNKNGSAGMFDNLIKIGNNVSGILHMTGTSEIFYRGAIVTKVLIPPLKAKDFYGLVGGEQSGVGSVIVPCGFSLSTTGDVQCWSPSNVTNIKFIYVNLSYEV
ncbi:BppU family phage baseplate upper protein [Clostridium paraputrificum]|uniref:BppU family phage baseplate upper protein n=1 Tax=Clostridium paraputrificum TaxID=29363 RepID=UPI00374F1E17